MATTKIWPVKGSVGQVLRYIQNENKTDEANQPDDLDSVLRYIGQGEKTDARKFVSGINCNPDTARLEMEGTKRQWGKSGGIVAYHAYQSFAPGEVTPEQAHQIGVQLANELWGDRFQVVVATHLDKESHLHNHFAVNSVSFVDGKRFRCNIGFHNLMRAVSDRLCLENGLSVVRVPGKGTGRHYAEYAAEKKGRPTWRTTIKADLDRAIAASRTDRQFFDTLRAMGYDYKIGQDISVRPPGKERFFRLARNLGEDYTMEALSMALAHGEMHKATPDYQPGQVRNSFYARCVSYMVCRHYGVEPKNYNFSDLQASLGNCNSRELRGHMEAIRSVIILP